MTAPTLTPARAIPTPLPKATVPVRATTSSPAKGPTAPKERPLGANQLPAPTKGVATPTSDPPVRETTSDQPSAIPFVAPTRLAPMADPMLALLADVLDDLEQTRIANENRLRQLTRDEDDSDGINRGFGLTADQPQVASVLGLVNGLAAMEHQATLALQRAMRQHPLGPWVKQTKGVGEKQGARLLAAIGDPYWNTLHDRPRTVSELWAFCGYHVLRTGHSTTGAHAAVAGAAQLPGGGDARQSGLDAQKGTAGVAPSRVRGQQSNWSTTAKMRTFLVAESCMKRPESPYRAVYLDTRVKYADAVHAVECRRCGPKGKPALPGSPLSDGHKHARALRAVSKAVLRDLWRESKRLHEEQT